MSKAPGDLRRFLFLQYEAPLGASIMATATFRALRRAVPDAFIAVACGAMAFQTFKNCPDIDLLIPTANPLSEPIAAAWQFVRKITIGLPRFDCVITDPSNRRSRIALLGLLARPRLRMGYTLKPKLYDLPLAYSQKDGLLNNNLRLVESLGYARREFEPAMYFAPQDSQAIMSRLDALGIDAGRPLIAIASQFSGGYPTQRWWHADRFAGLADRMAAELGCQLIFVGTERERPKVERIRGMMEAPSVNLAGALNVSELAALLTQCDLLVSLDTGTVHVARGVGLPTMVICRPWETVPEWLPLGTERHLILMKDEVVERTAREPDFVAPLEIDEISTDEAFEAVQTQLLRYPPSVADRRARLQSHSHAAVAVK